MGFPHGNSKCLLNVISQPEMILAYQIPGNITRFFVFFIEMHLTFGLFSCLSYLCFKIHYWSSAVSGA